MPLNANVTPASPHFHACFAPVGHVVVELRDADNEAVVRLGISDKMCPTQEDKMRKVSGLWA